MLEHVVDALFGFGSILRSTGEASVPALLTHAELGGHGDHQLIPAGQHSDAINGCLLKGAALAFLLDRGTDDLLNRAIARVLEQAQFHRSPQCRHISREADVGEMITAVTTLEANNLSVVGKAAPNVRVPFFVAKEGEFPVLQTGGGSETQHVSLHGNAFHRQMFVYVALDQIGNSIRDGEIGHQCQSR